MQHEKVRAQRQNSSQISVFLVRVLTLNIDVSAASDRTSGECARYALNLVFISVPNMERGWTQLIRIIVMRAENLR